jgi:hypothetical protein
VRSSPTLGTSSSYVAFTLKLPRFVYTFISKVIKKHSSLVALLRINPNPLVGSEASFLYHAIRARPGPATDKAEPPSRARWGNLPKSQHFFFFNHFSSVLISLPHIGEKP